MDALYTTVVFAIVFATVLVGLSLRQEAAAARTSRVKRLQIEEDSDGPTLTKRMSRLSHEFAAFPFLQKLETYLLQSGIYWSVNQCIALTGMLFALGLICGLMIGHDWLLAIAGSVAAGLIPGAYVVVRRRRRIDAFMRQLPFALDVIKASLEAGHTLLRALQVLVGEFDAPLGSEFRLVLEQTRIGVSLSKALEDLAQRVPESDLRLLVVAVRVQSDIGSSLAPIVGRLAELVRARQRLQQQVNTFSSHLRLGGVVVGLLPVVVLTIFGIREPSYTAILFKDPTGIMLLKTAITCDVLAFLIVRRMMKLRY